MRLGLVSDHSASQQHWDSCHIFYREELMLGSSLTKGPESHLERTPAVKSPRKPAQFSSLLSTDRVEGSHNGVQAF